MSYCPNWMTKETRNNIFNSVISTPPADGPEIPGAPLLTWFNFNPSMDK